MKTGGKFTKTEFVLLAAAAGFLLGLALAFLSGRGAEPQTYTISAQRRAPEALTEEASPAGGDAEEASEEGEEVSPSGGDAEDASEEEEEAVPAGPVDINTASLKELDTLPGIGPALAQRIIDYRAEHGPFRTLDDLTSVRGIGPATLEKLRELAVAGTEEAGAQDGGGETSDKEKTA